VIGPAMEIDGIPVERAEAPESAEKLAQVMKAASDAGMSMIAVGGGTKLHLGNPPRSAQLAVHTSRLQGIVEYEPDNLTISVRAGTTLENLQRELSTENQFLPLDPPQRSGATIGGVVACNASGPIRFRYGTVRDMLIGIRIVHVDGTQTKAGGKLVKNVTGYDMCKLYAGSLGTLGIFSELTFKVQPKPEAVATVFLAYPSLRGAQEAAQAMLHADLTPDAMEALDGQAFEALTGEAHVSPWILLLRFGETDASVRWQVDRVREIAATRGGTVFNVLDTPESERCWQRVASVRESPGSGEELLLKCSVLYHSAVETERRMRAVGERLQARFLCACHAGTNILYGRYEWLNGSSEAGDVRREITELRRYCVSVGGHMVVEKARPDVKRDLDVWGYQAPALDLMRRIKTQFDPAGLLNPGRFAGGI
jgi:glycolate oxidase FAD binding subunit